jgi:hypothetical protein
MSDNPDELGLSDDDLVYDFLEERPRHSRFSGIVDELQSSPDFGRGAVRFTRLELVELAECHFKMKLSRTEKRHKPTLLMRFAKEDARLRQMLEDPAVERQVAQCIVQQAHRRQKCWTQSCRRVQMDVSDSGLYGFPCALLTLPGRRF